MVFFLQIRRLYVLGFVRELRVFSQWELGKNRLSPNSTKLVRVLSSSSLVVDLEWECQK
jgi:hypothetical protein